MYETFKGCNIMDFAWTHRIVLKDCLNNIRQ
jgi:hypothetical protein